MSTNTTKRDIIMRKLIRDVAASRGHRYTLGRLRHRLARWYALRRGHGTWYCPCRACYYTFNTYLTDGYWSSPHGCLRPVLDITTQVCAVCGYFLHWNGKIS